MVIKFKVWLEDKKGESLLGDGRLRLLREIERTGSLNAAAEQLGLSYRDAWGRIRKLEQRLGSPVLERRIGGEGGGGSNLTPDAKKLIEKYEKIRGRTEKYACAEFSRSGLA